MSHPKKQLVVVIHAGPVVRRGLFSIINAHDALEVVGEAGCIRAGRDLCARIYPSIIVLDPKIGGGDGMFLIHEFIRDVPKARIVAFTAVADAADVQQAFQAGVSAYLTQDDSIEVVIAAIAAVAVGERHFGAAVERILIDRFRAGAIELRSKLELSLSDREMQVFRLVGAGQAAREVAETLGISVKTIESHQQRIKQKLRFRSGAEMRQQAACFCATTFPSVSGNAVAGA